MGRINIDAIIAPECDLKTLARLSKMAEKYNFNAIWMGDGAYQRDYASCLTIMAQATKRIGVGLAVTNPYLRHPIKSALAIASVNEISGGRALMGIGAGSLDTLKSLGHNWNMPVERISDMITAVRSFLSGRSVELKTDTISIEGVKAWMPLISPIPIYVGCRRPLMMRMAGRFADGVLLDNVPIEYLPFALDQLKTGSELSRRDFTKFDVGNLSIFAVSEDKKEAMKRVKRHLPYDFITISKRELRAVGLTPRDIEPMLAALRRQLPEDFMKASEFVTDYMVKNFSTSGTPEECIRRIKDYSRAGVTRILLGLPTEPSDKPEETLKLAGESILPELN